MYKERKKNVFRQDGIFSDYFFSVSHFLNYFKMKKNNFEVVPLIHNKTLYNNMSMRLCLQCPPIQHKMS